MSILNQLKEFRIKIIDTFYEIWFLEFNSNAFDKNEIIMYEWE
jgi:hypothetical protein